jgi:DNA-binding transcriptional ArsR family regulator
MKENNPSRDIFDAIADPTRRRLIQLLSQAEELPLHELIASKSTAPYILRGTINHNA